jgi:hypothetical protein
MRRVPAVLCVVGVALHLSACGRLTREVRLVAAQPANIHELWQEPADIQQRDLFHGPGGSSLKVVGCSSPVHGLAGRL